MSAERHEKTSQKAAYAASRADVAVEITAITGRKPHGLMRFSRCRKVLKNKEKEREERDFIIPHSTLRAPTYMTPARVYARGARLSREVFSARHRYFPASALEDRRGNSRALRFCLLRIANTPGTPCRRS
jgi:hypothetical protein